VFTAEADVPETVVAPPAIGLLENLAKKKSSGLVVCHEIVWPVATQKYETV
jgi:hypothetical protein